MRERRVSGPWVILQVSTNYAVWLRIKGPHANTSQIVFQGMLMCYSETGKLSSLPSLQVSTRSQTAFPVMGKGWLRPAGGHSCDLRGFSNPDSSRKSVLCLAAVLQLWWGTKGSPRRDSWDWTRSPLPTAQSSPEHWSFLRKHQITSNRGVFPNCGLAKPWPLHSLLSSLCFSLGFCSGPVRDLGEKGQRKHQFEKSRGVLPCIPSTNIFTGHLFMAGLFLVAVAHNEQLCLRFSSFFLSTRWGSDSTLPMRTKLVSTNGMSSKHFLKLTLQDNC